MNRRDFVAGAALMLGAPSVIVRRANAQTLGKDTSFPFSVASGDPTSDAVVLWTRLARSAADLTPISRKPVEVEWIVASDERLSKVVRRGIAIASPEYGHSVHVDVAGLESNREYWYAFRIGGEMSPIGRARTLPAATDRVTRYCFNVVSCQNWEFGYFDAYDGMRDDGAAFVMHVGDYIYEVTRGGGVRKHETAAFPRTLDDYRRRHALYKTDPALRRAHESMTFIVTLDNHDALYDNTTDPVELNRRAAAYQAWYEFQPVRYAPLRSSATMQIQRQYEIGNLISMTIPDTRQFRDKETPCADDSDKNFAFGVYEKVCPASKVANRSMLGQPQEVWLDERLKTSTARWNVLANTVKMSPFDMDHNGELYRYLQSWDGYPAERGRILDRIAASKVSNPISLSGDIHSYLISSVVRNVGDDPATALMTEFVGTSISAPWPEPLAEPMYAALPHNPHINFYDASKRGYMRCTFNENRMTTDLRTIDTVFNPGGTVATERSYVVENGQVGAKNA
ncbi:alkaline phosphatase D family protein [Paraburkholderia xenovorans]|uniref:alkaline phosphatase D family protein n=1 Tax=Paraburkholderia xenovorans TaxID=36873 RepID=UPI0038BC5B1B